MKHIWIVDDDEEMSRAVGLMLKLLNCEVATFFNVRAAAQTLLISRRPDLIILDINMPEVSGLDMVEFLRRRPESKNIPIVMLSSEAADSIVDKALELGADSYIMKPVTIEELEKAMITAFEKHPSL
ncbi:MAG: response regulator [Anaerolineae bacterium]|nr:response regulator [Anaerolineae bacterium]MCI0609486.1 response regulator [Anaerolineae bacterium]